MSLSIRTWKLSIVLSGDFPQMGVVTVFTNHLCLLTNSFV